MNMTTLDISLSFYDWPILLSIKSSRFSQVLALGNIILRPSNISLYVHIILCLSIHLIMDLLAIVNNVVMYVQIYLQTLL